MFVLRTLRRPFFGPDAVFSLDLAPAVLWELTLTVLAPTLNGSPHLITEAVTFDVVWETDSRARTGYSVVEV
jgi:hypothetical protein